MSNSSSKAIINSTISKESAPKSSINDASSVTAPSVTPNFSYMSLYLSSNVLNYLIFILCIRFYLFSNFSIIFSTALFSTNCSACFIVNSNNFSSLLPCAFTTGFLTPKNSAPPYSL